MNWDTFHELGEASLSLKGFHEAWLNSQVYRATSAKYIPAWQELSVGLIKEHTEGYDVDYAEIVGCTSVDDRGTSDTFPPFPLIVILLRWKCDALT